MSEKQGGKSELQVVISAILDRLMEKDTVVTNAAITSLRKLSKIHVNDVIFECCSYCKESKLKKDHLIQILGIIEFITQEYIINIDGDGVIMLVDFCLSQITEQAEVDIQKTASEILVAVGKQHPVQIVEVLSKNLEDSCKEMIENSANTVHSVILYTLGSLAAANPCAVVPHMKQIFSLLLPLLGITKSEIYNAVAYVMGRFGDALQEYCLNGNKVPDPTLNCNSFQVELSFICDNLTNSLNHSRDPKESLLALASVLPVVNGEKVGQHIRNLLPIVLTMCKKQKELFASVQCLSSIILVSSQTNGTILEPSLNNLVVLLIDLIQPEQDYAQPYLIRVHAEALRCYEHLSKHFTDYCIDHLLKMLKPPTNDKNRLKSLLVFNHLINSTEDVIKNKMSNFLQILSDLLDNSSVVVKKVLLRTVVALSCKDLLPKDVQPDYCRFILQLCDNVKLEKSENVNHEMNSLKEGAENTLYLLSTTVPQLGEALCNVLLQSVLQGKQNPILFRCLATLAISKPEFWEKPNVNVIIRCLVTLGSPLPISRCQNVLRFLQCVRPCQGDGYKTVWDRQIPQLLKYLEQNQNTLNESDWIGLVIDFLSMCLESIDNNDFTDSVIYSLRTEIEKSCKEDVELLLRLLAVTTCYLKNVQQVSPSLKCIIKAARPYDGPRLNACARALAISSKTHMKLVMEELAALRKEFLHKGHNKLIGFFGGHQKNEIAADKIRVLLLTSYSEICANPIPLLFQTIEKDILDFAVEELNNCKDITVRSACLNTIRAVAEAMHPSKNSLHVRMRDRTEVSQVVSSQLQLHSGPEFVQLFPCTLPVLTALVKLPPALEPDQRVQLLSHSISTVLNASAVYCKMSEDGTKYGDLKLAAFVYSSFSHLSHLVQEIIVQSPNHFALDELVLLIEPWLGRKKPEQRLPALEILENALSTYLEHCQFAYGAPGGFTHCGTLVSHLVPRSSDSNKNIRRVAIKAMKLALCIAARHEGHAKDYDKVIEQKLAKPLENICTEESRMLCNLMMDVAHACVNHVPRIQLPQFINGLVDSLVDIELQSCYCSSLVLNSVIKIKSGDVPEHIPTILDKILLVLNKIECPRTRSTSLRSVLALALSYPRVVINNLLTKPLPYQQVICDCWAVLSTDESVVLNIFDYFKKIFQTTAPYEEKLTATDKDVVTLQPLQAICALNEICKNLQLQTFCKQQFPDVFCRLLVTLASYSEAIIPAFAGGGHASFKEIYSLKPTDLCVHTTKQLLICCGYDDMANVFPEDGRIEKLGHVLDLMPKLAKEMGVVAPDLLPWMVSSLAPFTRSELIPWRSCATKFLASLLEFNTEVSSVLAENIIEILLGAQSDTSFEVRQAAFYGLGVALEKLPWETTWRYCDGIVKAFLRALEYFNGKEELQVILETLISFSKLLRTLEKNNHCEINSFQVTAVIRIKPLFEQENGELRAAAFHLLGDLARSSTKEKNAEAFKEQVCGDLVPLMLHLVDESDSVVQACKFALQKIAPILNSSKISEIIEEKVLMDRSMSFTEFANDFVIALSKEFRELLPALLQTSAAYWKSDCVMLRAHAALLARIIIQELNEENLKDLPVNTLNDRLLKLCEDPDPYVRAQAIKTMTSFFLR